MKNERILSYKVSQKLSVEDLQEVSAAGMTSFLTANATHGAQGWDPSIDVQVDF